MKLRIVSSAGLEPAIVASEAQNVIHYTTRTVHLLVYLLSAQAGLNEIKEAFD